MLTDGYSCTQLQTPCTTHCPKATKSEHNMATSDDFLPKIIPVYTLTSADRCDARGCGARAYIRATITLGLSDLLFCGHHGRHHKPKLIDLVHDWVDETDNITPKRLPTDQYVSY